MNGTFSAMVPDIVISPRPFNKVFFCQYRDAHKIFLHLLYKLYE